MFLQVKRRATRQVITTFSEHPGKRAIVGVYAVRRFAAVCSIPGTERPAQACPGRGGSGTRGYGDYPTSHPRRGPGALVREPERFIDAVADESFWNHESR